MLEKRTANTFKLTQALAQTVIQPLEVDTPEIDLKLKATSIIVKTNKTEDGGGDVAKRQQLNKRQTKEASKAAAQQQQGKGGPHSSTYSLRVRRPETKPAVVYTAAADHDQNKENKVVRVTLQKTEAEPQATGARSRSSRSHKALRSKSNNSAAVEKATITANVTSHE